MLEHTFTCADADGTEHTYTVQPHRGHEGAPLALQLLSLVVEPIATGAGPVVVQGLGKVRGKGKAALQQLATDPELLEALDLAALARGVKLALLGLRPAFLYAVLRYTNRDGKPLVTDAGKPTGTFDSAYARNYAELGKAMWEVAQWNGFFPALDTIAAVARKAVAAMPETIASDA